MALKSTLAKDVAALNLQRRLQYLARLFNTINRTYLDASLTDVALTGERNAVTALDDLAFLLGKPVAHRIGRPKLEVIK